MDGRIELWEYKILWDPTTKELNDYGEEGWELVTVVRGRLFGTPGLGYWAYMKRALQ